MTGSGVYALLFNMATNLRFNVVANFMLTGLWVAGWFMAYMAYKNVRIQV